MPTEGGGVEPSMRLPRRVRFLFGVGGLAESLKSVTFGLFLLFFYNNVLGLSGTVIGIVTAIGLVWDAVIDPSIGRASDRLQSKFGRRHLPMLAGALLSGPLFFAVFSPPELSTTGLAVWLLVFGLLLRTSHSLFLVPYYALGAELSDDYQERSALSGVRTAFVFIGTLIVVVPSFLIFFAEEAGVDGKFQADGYASMGASFGLLMTCAGLAAVFGTASERERLRPTSIQQQQQQLFAEVRGALSQPSYRRLAFSGSIFFMGSVANASLGISYLTYYARISGSEQIAIFQAGFYLGALAGVPSWLRLARSVDKHRLYSGACLALSAIAVSAYALVGEGRLVEPGTLAPMVAGHAVSGFVASALWILPASMLADATDADELRHGRRREATLFGIYSLGHQIAAGLALIVTGVLLDVVANVAAGSETQSAATIERIGILFGAVPAILFLLANRLIAGYDLTRAKVAQIQRELALRSQPAAAASEE